jgi:hypothetical protein
MDVYAVLADLYEQKDKLDEVIEALERLRQAQALNIAREKSGSVFVNRPSLHRSSVTQSR